MKLPDHISHISYIYMGTLPIHAHDVFALNVPSYITQKTNYSQCSLAPDLGGRALPAHKEH